MYERVEQGLPDVKHHLGVLRSHVGTPEIVKVSQIRVLAMAKALGLNEEELTELATEVGLHRRNIHALLAEYV